MERRQNTHNGRVSVTAWTESDPGPPPLNSSRHVGSETRHGRTKHERLRPRLPSILDRAEWACCIDLHRILAFLSR